MEEALALGGDQAVLELAQAVDYVRPRAPAPIILPVHTHTARVTHALGHAFGPSLSVDLEAAVAAVKPRVMGGWWGLWGNWGRGGMPAACRCSRGLFGGVCEGAQGWCAYAWSDVSHSGMTARRGRNQDTRPASLHVIQIHCQD